MSEKNLIISLQFAFQILNVGVGLASSCDFMLWLILLSIEIEKSFVF